MKKCLTVIGLLWVSLSLYAQDSLRTGPQLAYQSALFKPLLAPLQPNGVAAGPAALGPRDAKIRPFITDDARVVGGRLAQAESWVRFDKESGQHWTLFAYGPTDRLELTIGGVLGYERSEERRVSFSYALPLLQAKYLFRRYQHGRGPGVAGVFGTFLPAGRGSFRPAGYGTFGFLILTQCFGEQEQLLLHANVGGNYLHIDGTDQFINTWGIGTQIKVYRGMHFVGELFSGDPYIPGTGTAYQLGYRYIFSDLFQIDMTVGNGIGGANPMPLWFSAGVRIVTERFLRKQRSGPHGRGPHRGGVRQPIQRPLLAFR